MDKRKPFECDWQQLALQEHRLGDCLGLGQAEISAADLSSVRINELDLTLRSFKCLIDAGIRTADDLLRCSPSQLLRLPNFGMTSLHSIVEALVAAFPEWITGPLPYPAEGSRERVCTGFLIGHQFMLVDEEQWCEIIRQEMPLGVSDTIPLKEKLLGLAVSDLALGKRTLNILSKHRIDSWERLAELSPVQLLELPGFGDGCLRDMIGALLEAVYTVNQSSLVDELGLQSEWLSCASGLAVEALSLTARPLHCLKDEGILTIGQLAGRSRASLLGIRSMGRKSVEEIVRKLQSFDALSYRKVPFGESGPVFRLKDELRLSEEQLQRAKSVPLEALELSRRPYNCLTQAGVRNLYDLLLWTRSDLYAIRNMGKRSLNEIVQRVQSVDLDAPVQQPVLKEPAYTLDWTSPELLFKSYLMHLRTSERNIELFLKRFGLLGGKSAERKDLAAEFGITRMRVGDIDIRLRDRVRSGRSRQALGTLWDAVNGKLAQCGGSSALWCMCMHLARQFGWDDMTLPTVEGLAKLIPSTSVNKDLRLIRSDTSDGADCASCIRQATSLLSANGGSMHMLDFAKHAMEWAGDGSERAERWALQIARHFSHLADGIVFQDDRLYSQEYWSLARGRSLRQVVRDTFLSIGHPVHYRDLTARIRKSNKRHAKCSETLVYRYLRDIPGCVATAPGVYGLAVWGLTQYRTPAQAIADRLTASGQPLGRRGLITELSAEGFAVQDLLRAMEQHPDFVEVSDGIIDLRERAERQEIVTTADELMIVVDDDDRYPGYETSASQPDRVADPGRSVAYVDSDGPSEIGRLRALICERMNASYKPVLFLCVLDCVDVNGRADLDAVATRFGQFYADRRAAGLQVERQHVSIANTSNWPPDIRYIKRVLLRHPVRLYLESGLFELSGREIRFVQRVWERLDPEGLRMLSQMARTQIDEYFGRMGS